MAKLDGRIDYMNNLTFSQEDMLKAFTWVHGGSHVLIDSIENIEYFWQDSGAKAFFNFSDFTNGKSTLYRTPLAWTINKQSPYKDRINMFSLWINEFGFDDEDVIPVLVQYSNEDYP